MSYNGSGTFNINTAGQPVVTGTVISSTAFNALTADLGTGLSTAITKDGQTTTTAVIPFAAGINVPTSALGTCYSGTYTPTLTNGTNVAASTAFACQYMRVGNVVTVSGQVNIDPTSTATYTQLEMTIPVASNFSAGNQCGGTGITIPGSGLNATAAIYANATTDGVTLGASFPDAANQAVYFSFTYLVI